MPDAAWGTDELLHLGGAGGLAPRVRAHRPACAFGPGFYRLAYALGGETREAYFQEQGQADSFARLLPPGTRCRAYRDACLDGPPPRTTAANTPGAVDAEWWLGLPRAQAMAELGLRSEREYARVALAVEPVVARSLNREAQGGVRARVLLPRRSTNEVVTGLPPRTETITSMRLTGHLPRHMLPHPGPLTGKAFSSPRPKQ